MPEHVLRLAAREAERGEVVLARLGDPLARRKRDRQGRSGHAKTLDEAAADREGRMKRHLLRGDGRHERLEGIRRERRAVAGKPAHRLGQHGIALRKGIERPQLHLDREELSYHRLDSVIERLHVHAVPCR